MKRSLGLLVAALLAAAPAHAYFEQTDAGSRTTAMGPSGMAIVNDVTAYHWNPAALASVAGPELVFDHAKPYGTPNLAENAFAAGTQFHGTGLALAWHRLGVTDVYAEDQICLAAGRTMFKPRGGHRVDLGATFKYGRAGFQAFDVAGVGSVDYGAQAKGSLDFGARWRTPWAVDFSWVARDLLQPRYQFVDGTGGEHLLARHEAAAAFRWNRESTITFGYAQLAGKASTMSAGMEILFFNVFALRSGLRNISRVYEAQQSPNDLQFSGGFGVFHKGYYVDAAAETSHDLGASYRVSVRFAPAPGGKR